MKNIPYIITLAAFCATPALYAARTDHNPNTSSKTTNAYPASDFYQIDETAKTITVWGEGVDYNYRKLFVPKSADQNELISEGLLSAAINSRNYVVVMAAKGKEATNIIKDEEGNVTETKSVTTGEMFKGSGETIKSLDGTATPTSGTSSWNVVGNLNIDINSATTANAITSGSNNWTWRIGTINIQNSGSTSADVFANVDLGTNFTLTTNNATETSRLNFETNTNVTGNAITLNNGIGGITVSANKVVNADNTAITVKSKNTMSLESGASLSAKSLTLSDTVAFSMLSNSALTSAGTVALSNSATMSMGEGSSMTANTLVLNDTASATIGKDATLNLDALTIKSGTSISFGEGVTLDVGGFTVDSVAVTTGTNSVNTIGTLTLYNASSFTVTSGSTLNIGNVNTNAQSTFTTGGNVTFTSENAGSVNIHNLVVTGGTLTAKKTTDGTDAGLKLSGTNNVFSGGTLEIKGRFQASAGSVVTIESTMGDIILSSSVRNYEDNQGNPQSETYAGRVTIWEGGKLILNKENAFIRDGGENANLLVKGTGNVLELNAANAFSQLYYVTATDALEIKLSSDTSNTLYFSSKGGASGGSLFIDDFQDNMIFFKDKTNVLETLIITAETIDGKALTEADLEFVSGSYGTTQGFWLNQISASVPEPAEWAAILGALALGLAIYRRRK